MTERGECVEPGDPHDRIAEPGVHGCDRRAQVVRERERGWNLDPRKQRDRMPFEPRTGNGGEWNREEEYVERRMRQRCRDLHPPRSLRVWPSGEHQPLD